MFPSLFISTMVDPKEKIISLLEPLLEKDMFLVDMRIKPTNNIKIYIDSDEGLSIEKCIRINRALYKQLEEIALFTNGDFSLEISSPGLDEPLKLHRQYVKNKGRKVDITLTEGQIMTGLLMDVNENGVVLKVSEGKGKKAVEKELDILWNNIKQTKVLISF